MYYEVFDGAGTKVFSNTYSPGVGGSYNFNSGAVGTWSVQVAGVSAPATSANAFSAAQWNDIAAAALKSLNNNPTSSVLTGGRSADFQASMLALLAGYGVAFTLAQRTQIANAWFTATGGTTAWQQGSSVTPYYNAWYPKLQAALAAPSYSQAPVVSWAGSLSGYTGTLSMADAPNFTLYATIAGMANTNIQFTVATTNYVGDTHNNQSAVEVVIQDSATGAWVLDIRSPSATTYSFAGDANGTYNIWMRAIATNQGHNFTGTITLYPNIAFTYYYWSNSSNSLTYTYPTTNLNSGVLSTYTENNPNIYAPVPATPIGFVIQSYSNTSNAYGAATLYCFIYDPNGNSITPNGTPITGVGNYSYSNTTAIKGQYRYDFRNMITTNNQNAVGNQNYVCNFSGYTYNYDMSTVPNTVWFDNAGNAATYLTAAATLAPVNTATAISLNLSSVTTDASAVYGSNYIVIRLMNPAGAFVTDSTSNSGLQYSLDGGVTWNACTHPGAPWVTDGGIAVVYGGLIQVRYWNTSAVGGIYSWVVYGQINANDTGNHQYSNSWSGTQTYYLVGGTGETYVLSGNGKTQRIGANDSDINFIGTPLPDSLSFQVFNSYANTLPFSVSVDYLGV